MSKNAFENEMRTINRFANGYFPCGYCYYFGIILMFFTFGLSLCFPKICVSDVYYIIYRVKILLMKN